MKEIMNFLKESGVFFLATVDGNQPRVRPIGFVMEDEGRLVFCTSNDKEMCKQMASNQNVEICCIDKEMNTLRICGKASFCTTPEMQKKALDYMPVLDKMYSVGDGKFELYYLESPQAVCQTVQGDKHQLTL